MIKVTVSQFRALKNIAEFGTVYGYRGENDRWGNIMLVPDLLWKTKSHLPRPSASTFSALYHKGLIYCVGPGDEDYPGIYELEFDLTGGAWAILSKNEKQSSEE